MERTGLIPMAGKVSLVTNASKTYVMMLLLTLNSNFATDARKVIVENVSKEQTVGTAQMHVALAVWLLGGSLWNVRSEELQGLR
mmetsp:Transcript_6132/g.13360  ORF Transcript_6132/g.13360 Transcript_6132/m.13360 type:complete len:84 (-) Transcript_6132:181-432(-)